MRVRLPLFVIVLIGLFSPHVLIAQDSSGQLAATLEVLAQTVEVRRVDTSNWIPVKIEAIVGVGDTIRTNAQGRARITFFANGVDTDLLPNTEYRIKQFQGDQSAFNLTVEVVAGQTVQRLNKLLDANSSYKVNTPAMELVARGTEFAIRVEGTGRSAMLVTRGVVDAGAQQATADVSPGFGVRTAVSQPLSDVVKATSFQELDSALDGCPVSVTTPDDVRVNVRLGPSLDFQRVGTADAKDITQFIGKNESGKWYRISFRGGFGWILSSSAQIVKSCAGLRVFPNNYGPEDASRYTTIGDPIQLEATAEATAEATQSP
jgi:hypothetical protein